MTGRKRSEAPSTLSGSKATRRRFLGAATAGGVAAWSGLTIFSRTAHAAGGPCNGRCSQPEEQDNEEQARRHAPTVGRRGRPVNPCKMAVSRGEGGRAAAQPTWRSTRMATSSRGATAW